MQINANGTIIEVETHGLETNAALLLIRGLGTQLIHWPDEFIDGLVERGFHVITFDNRDCGLSQIFDVPGKSYAADDLIAAVKQGEQPKAPYGMADFAGDILGILDALNIDRAHVFGISLGGMIAQVLSVVHPDRLLSASFVMTAAMRLRGLDDESLWAQPESRAAYMTSWVEGYYAYGGSPGYPLTEQQLLEQAGRAWDRGVYPDGNNRQMLAAAAEPDHREDLRKLALPCLVIHGTSDRLIPKEAGQEIASLIPDAETRLIEGMGHYITPLLSPVIVDILDDFITRRGVKVG